MTTTSPQSRWQLNNNHSTLFVHAHTTMYQQSHACVSQTVVGPKHTSKHKCTTTYRALHLPVMPREILRLPRETCILGTQATRRTPHAILRYQWRLRVGWVARAPTQSRGALVARPLTCSSVLTGALTTPSGPMVKANSFGGRCTRLSKSSAHDLATQ